MAHPPGDWQIRDWEDQRDFCDSGHRYCPYRAQHYGECSPEECIDREADEISQNNPELITLDDMEDCFGCPHP